MSGFIARVILPSDLIPLSRRDQAKNVYMSEKSVRFYPHHNFVAILLYSTYSFKSPQKFHLFIVWHDIEQILGVLTPY